MPPTLIGTVAIMPDEMIDRVYSTDDPEALRDVYDEWATDYDADLAAERYATPDRIADALGRHLGNGGPVLDFGCGTGLSGIALSRAGFGQIDGYDVSSSMLDVARTTGAYRSLVQGRVGESVSVDLGSYVAVVACGAISTGAAPSWYLDDIIDGLAPGALFVVSLNEHALGDPDFVGRIDAAVSNGRIERLEAVDGPHLPERGLTATVFVLRRV